MTNDALALDVFDALMESHADNYPWGVKTATAGQERANVVEMARALLRAPQSVLSTLPIRGPRRFEPDMLISGWGGFVRLNHAHWDAIAWVETLSDGDYHEASKVLGIGGTEKH